MKYLATLTLIICFASCKKEQVEPGPILREIQIRYQANNHKYAIWWENEKGETLRDSVLALDTFIVTYAYAGKLWKAGGDHKSPHTKLEMYVTVVNGGISNGWSSGYKTVNSMLTIR